jgi:hypothetical protein
MIQKRVKTIILRLFLHARVCFLQMRLGRHFITEIEYVVVGFTARATVLITVAQYKIIA